MAWELDFEASRYGFESHTRCSWKKRGQWCPSCLLNRLPERVGFDSYFFRRGLRKEDAQHYPRDGQPSEDWWGRFGGHTCGAGRLALASASQADLAGFDPLAPYHVGEADWRGSALTRRPRRVRSPFPTPCRCSPMAGGHRLRSGTVWVRLPSPAPLQVRRCNPNGRVTGFRLRECGFESRHRHRSRSGTRNRPRLMRPK